MSVPPMPPSIADEAAASVLVKGITAYMLRVYPVGAGTTVLIHSAAGGLGQLMTRWALHLGATVIGTVGLTEVRQDSVAPIDGEVGIRAGRLRG